MVSVNLDLPGNRGGEEMSDTFIISRHKYRPAIVRGTRVEAMQALEMQVRLDAGVTKDLRGNTAVRLFVEGEKNYVQWGDHRLDLVEDL